MIRGVIFDLGGTLITQGDFEEPNSRALLHWLRAGGHAVPESFVEMLIAERRALWAGRKGTEEVTAGQAIGAAVQGLGGALLERLVYDEAGQLVTATFADYAMPTAKAFSQIDAITLEEAPSTLNPLGAKGAGEGGLVATGAAVANAVAAALAPTGAVIRELPLSPDKVYEQLARARARH